MRPEVFQFERKYAGRVNVVSVDVREANRPEYRKYIGYFGGGAVPCVTVIDSKGKVITWHEGPMPEFMMEQLVSPYLPPQKTAVVKKGR